MSSPDEDLVSVGLDIGSANARIFFISKAQSQQPSIVPNEIGQRYTLALSTPEPEIEADPLNDQYWENGYGKKKNKDKKQPKEIHYLYGDSARRTLHRLKKPLGPHTILNMIKEQQEACDEKANGDGDDNSIEIDAEAIESVKDASASFFKHLTNLTTHATHTSPQSLRFVLSVPPHVSDGTHVSHLSSNVHAGIMEAIEKAGYNKREKKTVRAQRRVVSVLTHPVAIAYAHKIFPNKTTNPRDIMIVDWGASALSISHLRIMPSGIASIQKHISESSHLSGKHIVSLLTQHIAELFERKARCIPRGETLQNKKARAKLEVAAEDAIRSFGFSPKVTVTIDGLIEGIDCHVDVMLARFEMLLGNMLRTAETKLKEFGTFDSVIGAGSIMKMKCVERMMDRLYPKGQIWRGESINDVPPDEAVAIGCALYGATYMNTGTNYVDNADDADINEKECLIAEEKVPLSPVGIGLSYQEGDPAATVLIDSGSPLPAHSTTTVDVAGISHNSMSLVQISADGNEKVIGRIENFDSDNSKEVEVTTGLSVEGKLSVSVNGGPICTI